MNNREGKRHSCLAKSLETTIRVKCSYISRGGISPKHLMKSIYLVIASFISDTQHRLGSQ